MTSIPIPLDPPYDVTAAPGELVATRAALQLVLAGTAQQPGLAAPACQGSGARIVHTCGFDSIPSDMGVYFLQKKAFLFSFEQTSNF